MCLAAALGLHVLVGATALGVPLARAAMSSGQPRLLWVDASVIVAAPGSGVSEPRAGGQEATAAAGPAAPSPTKPRPALRRSVPRVEPRTVSDSDALARRVSDGVDTGLATDASHTDDASLGSAASPASGGDSEHVVGAGHLSLGGDGSGSSASDRPRKPKLVGRGLPCRGLFPFRADGDAGAVTVIVDVDRHGAPGRARIVAESPSGQGFADAARACARRLAFEPATDAFGVPTASASMLKLEFARNK